MSSKNGGRRYKKASLRLRVVVVFVVVGAKTEKQYTAPRSYCVIVLEVLSS